MEEVQGSVRGKPMSDHGCDAFGTEGGMIEGLDVRSGG